MWKQISDFITRALSWGAQTQRNTDDVARSQQTMAEMVRVMHHFNERFNRLEARLDRLEETERHEREKQELRFQLALERLERRLSLPPNPPSGSEDRP